MFKIVIDHIVVKNPKVLSAIFVTENCGSLCVLSYSLNI